MTRGYWIALIVIALIVIGGVAVTFGVSPNLPEKEEFPRAPDFKVNIIGGREVTFERLVRRLRPAVQEAAK